MEQYFKDLLYLIGCAIHSRCAVLRKDMDIDRILLEAHGQSCLFWALSAMLSAENSADFPVLLHYKDTLDQKYNWEKGKKKIVYRFIRDMEAAGLKPVIIKGETLCRLYPDPLLRESVDTDIFFTNKEECKAAEQLLIQAGGTMKDYDAREIKHSAAMLPGAGRFEFHHHLFSKDFYELHLKKEDFSKEPLERITVNGTELTTLGKTDLFKFVLCHMIHHFLFGRCDLRQVCDILMYVQTFRDSMDKAELFRFLNSTGYTQLFYTLEGIGIEYLGFDKEKLFKAQYSKKTAELFLIDCFNGCTKGLWTKHNTTARGFGIFEMWLRREKFSFSPKALAKRTAEVLFPDKGLLYEQFPYCERYHVLIPAAWCNNIFVLIRGILQTRKKFRQRKKMLEQLGILENKK